MFVLALLSVISLGVKVESCCYLMSVTENFCNNCKLLQCRKPKLTAATESVRDESQIKDTSDMIDGERANFHFDTFIVCM